MAIIRVPNKSSATGLPNNSKPSHNKEKVHITVRNAKLTAKEAEEIVENIHQQAYHFVEHLQQWIERNSQPKRYNFPKPAARREPTRWAKRGPMARKDWVRFYNWAAKNAAPRTPRQAKIRKANKAESEKKREPKEPIPLEELMEHAAQMAVPRIRRKKYQYPPEPVYAYNPQIDYRRPTRRDRGRPFPPPEVPQDFQHIELEHAFWSQLRFPLRSSALTYNPTENILKLARPKVVPPLKQHCHIPEKPVEYVAPRRKMTYRQWSEHKRRLEYLAKPRYRLVIEYLYY